MAKNDSKAQKAARNLEYANKYRKKKAPFRSNRGPGGPRPAAAVGAVGATSSSGGPGVSSGPRRFYPAVCSACGTATEVPFEPTEGRQVLCRACFKPPAR